MTRTVITLLTDFGHRDPYVGIMKGRILCHCPEAQIVDLTHQIPPQNVRYASFHLEQSVDHFPPGTVHLAVVDPGVGTSRSMLAVRTSNALFVTPDNGLLTRPLLRLGSTLEVVELPTPPHASFTFHGRDVMAPAAGRLAAGCALSRLGRAKDDAPLQLDFPEPYLGPNGVEASVLIVDHFGNVMLDLTQDQGRMWFTPGSTWSLGGHPLTVSSTYADVAPGESLLLWSSHGLLELACRQGDAQERWGLRPEQRVELLPVAGSQRPIG